MTDGLKQILREWLEWAENGAGEHDVFRRDLGLCSMIFNYDCTHGTGFDYEMIDIFAHNSYPFGGERAYYEDKKNKTMHLNPERLVWVRKQLGVA